jgi:hypothetical protein
VDFFRCRPETNWLYGKCRIIDENDREIRRLITLYKNLRLRHYSYNMLLTENYISQMAVFFRRGVFDAVGYLDEKDHMVMDYDYWLRIGKLYPAAFLNEYVADFRWHTASKSGSDYKRQRIDAYNTAKRHAGTRKWPIWLHRLNLLKITVSYDIMRLARMVR